MQNIFPLPTGLRLLHYEPGDPETPMRLWIKSMRHCARCPLCQRRSRRVHSHYWRTLADLPCGTQPLRLYVRARRFFCGNHRCTRRIFAERLPELTTASAQRTNRLRQAQTCISQAAGSRPGTRLAARLAMPTSATTLLRLERAAPLPSHPTPRVLGVDDWAFRRGHHYGTILCDLEAHQVVDLLPDRTPETLAKWLQAHPGVEIVSRDRAEAYACGIRQGTPHALQVTDRWHLIKNLGQALERLLDDKRTLLKQAAQPPSTGNSPEQERAVLPDCAPVNRQQVRLVQEKQCRRLCRVERYDEVRDLFARGWNISAIALHLNLSRKTVRKFVTATNFPERKERAARPCLLDAYQNYLRQRWEAGCHNAATLFEEIRQRGYSGRYTVLRDLLQTWRSQPTCPPPSREKVSQRQAAMWTLRREADRTPRQHEILERLAAVCEPFRIANALTQRFLIMIRQRSQITQPQTFRAWLEEALTCEVPQMRSFAEGLQRDQAAVEAGLSLSWSNGPVEGSNNRLKFLKRRGYGRALFDLLRRRVLQPT